MADLFDHDIEAARKAAHRAKRAAYMRKYRTLGESETRKFSMSDWRAENKEHVKAYAKEYREKNIEKVKGYQKARYAKDRPKLLAYRKAYRVANIEKEKATQREWRENNKEKRKTKIDKWRQSNKEHVKAYAAAYHQRDYVKAKKPAYRERAKPQQKLYMREWRILNGDHVRKYNRAWFANLRATDPQKLVTIKRLNEEKRTQAKRSSGRITAKEVKAIFAAQRGKCAVCRERLTAFQVDHIIPLKKGGPHVRQNIQILCRRCNAKKGAKDPIEFMRERGFLL
jgi:5-methylcytosine-specific restriction endonuclease McrA